MEGMSFYKLIIHRFYCLHLKNREITPCKGKLAYLRVGGGRVEPPTQFLKKAAWQDLKFINKNVLTWEILTKDLITFKR